MTRADFWAPGGGAIAIEESDVQVVAAASVIDFGTGFDVTENPAGEANIALDLTEQVWTFAQGGFYFRDASGPLLATGASGDDLLLTGDMDISGHVAIGGSASLSTTVLVNLAESIYSTLISPTGIQLSLTQTGTVVVQAISATVTYQGNASGYGAYGVIGTAQTQATGAGSFATGLSFVASGGSAYVVNSLIGMAIQIQSTSAQTAAITEADGIKITGYYGGSKPTTAKGIYIASSFAPSGVVNAYGLHIEDLVGSTLVRLLEIGPATPYLRLVGGAAPAANQTNLYLAEGVTPTLRRVQWKDYSSLVAGDRVMVLV
jgi:hypothetical protein